MTGDKRVFSRISVPTQTSIVYKNRLFKVSLENLSLQGATVKKLDESLDLAKGKTCILKIMAEGDSTPIDLEAMTMYDNGKQLGFQFAQNDPQAVKKLHAIVSSNFKKTVD